MKLAQKLKSMATGGGRSFDPVTGAGATTPWSWRTVDGVYVGGDGAANVWLYYVLPTSPFEWESGDRQLNIGAPLDALFAELGETSTRPLGGMARLSNNREVHLLSVVWDETPEPPPESSDALAQYHRDAFQGLATPNKCLFVGARLRSAGRADTVAGTLRMLAERVAADDPPDLDDFAADRATVAAIFARNGGRRPKSHERAQLESWFNRGRGPDVFMVEERDHLDIDGNHPLEFAAVLGRELGFTRPIMHAPSSSWLASASGHEHGTVVVSVRGELEPAEVSRKRARQTQRQQKSQIEEQSRTGDLDHVEDFDRLGLAQAAESYFARGAPATLIKASVIMGRRAEPADETYVDVLRTGYGIEAVPLVHRQMMALDECQPCSRRRLGENRSFSNDLTPSVVAYSGIGAFSRIGDLKGALIGLSMPDLTPVYLDRQAASAENKPPVMIIVGESGGGKAQPLDAKVLTPSGWRLMGDVVVGDAVTGADGQAHPVTGVYPQGRRPIWRLTLDDGSSTECDEEHLWTVRPGGGRGRRGPWQTMTLAQLRDDLVASGGARRWQVPVVAPVSFAAGEALPVDPYLLGALLGDRRLARQVERAHAGGVDQLNAELAALGAFGGDHHDRVIPAPYLTAALADRLALLQGILDAAGGLRGGRPGSDIVVSVSSASLVGHLTELVQSLGGTARLLKPASAGEPGPRPASCARARAVLLVRLPPSMAPFRLSGKVAQYRPRATAPTRSVAEISFVGHKPAQCLMVDAADHLYVTDDMVVTHNTWLVQMAATQFTLDGDTTIVINPKPSDSLAPFAEAVGGRVVSMSQVASAGGAFDPFGFATPEMAAEIATDHILSVLGKGWTQAQELDLGRGLARGAYAGARCVGEALEFVNDEEVKDHIRAQVEGSTLFALGISYVPTKGLGLGTGLTLIEFDRELGLPDPGTPSADYSRPERIATAALRLVTRASLEILMRARGGTLIVDEAWVFLDHPQSLAALERSGRQGRSQRVLVILATQKLADVTSKNLDSHVSRVVVLQIETRREAEAALKLCGVEASEENLAFVRTAGSVKASEDDPGRPSLAIHLDLYGRHSAMAVTPVPAWCPELFSTNPEDRDRLVRRRARAEMAETAGQR